MLLHLDQNNCLDFLFGLGQRVFIWCDKVCEAQIQQSGCACVKQSIVTVNDRLKYSTWTGEFSQLSQAAKFLSTSECASIEKKAHTFSHYCLKYWVCEINLSRTFILFMPPERSSICYFGSVYSPCGLDCQLICQKKFARSNTEFL